MYALVHSYNLIEMSFRKSNDYSQIFVGKYVIDVKGKKTKGGGTTRNVAGSPAGCKWGLKVYDGQRVPQGTTLLTQSTMKTMPGWNVSATICLLKKIKRAKFVGALFEKLGLKYQY